MKTYRTEDYTSKREVLVTITCDLCGKVSKHDSWGSNSFDVKEVEISLKDGERYPEYGHHVEYSYDICPDCFMTKLVPYLETWGAKPTKKEVEW